MLCSEVNCFRPPSVDGLCQQHFKISTFEYISISSALRIRLDDEGIYIPLLARGGMLRARISEVDSEECSKYHWLYDSGTPRKAGQVYCRQEGKKILLSHFVLPEVEVQIDHVNGDRLDNRRENLRAATGKQNMQNRPVQVNSTTGVRGVHRHSNGTYSVKASVNGVHHTKYGFRTLEEAQIAVISLRSKFMPFVNEEFSRKGAIVPSPEPLPTEIKREIEEKRFHLRIRKVIRDLESECWEWQGSKTANGVPRISWEGKAINANRLALYFANGKWPDSACISHLCSTSSCLNPIHLLEESEESNRKRTASKTRWNREKHRHNCILTDEKVEEIRQKAVRHKVKADAARTLAPEYNVSFSTAYGIILGTYRKRKKES